MTAVFFSLVHPFPFVIWSLGTWVDPNWPTLPPVSSWPVTTRDQCNCFPGFSTHTLNELLYTGQTVFFVALVVQQVPHLFLVLLLLLPQPLYLLLFMLLFLLSLLL